MRLVQNHTIDSRMTYGRMTYGRMTYGRMTYGRMTYGRMTKSRSTHRFSPRDRSPRVSVIDEFHSRERDRSRRRGEPARDRCWVPAA